MPWRHRHYAEYSHDSFFNLPSWRQPVADPRALVRDIEAESARRGASVYVVLTRSLRVEAEMLNGRPGVLERVAATLRTWPTATQVYRNSEADVFRVSAPAQAPGRAAGQAPGHGPAGGRRYDRASRRPAPSGAPAVARASAPSSDAPSGRHGAAAAGARRATPATPAATAATAAAASSAAAATAAATTATSG